MDDLKEILAAATPGPWDVDPHGVGDCMGDVWLGEDVRVCENATSEDAHLIAMAPDLAAEVLRLRAEVERLTEALTPSCDTKAAYMGEIHCDCPTENWKHFVPWTSIKEIMAMIRARAALKGAE